ncbi:MAG: pyridoxal phosphate-dependent class II aminotransferase [Desulfobacterales bacterium]|nr:pyridoxal phosphate-dependent class II aminotransferase [Desulfobacterales bacterium]
MITGHGGNIYELAKRIGYKPSDIIDMSSNVNPLGPLPGVKKTITDNIRNITALPEVDAGGIIRAFSECYDIDPSLVLSGNGSTQLIYTIPRALGSQKALIVGPTYADYADACIMNDVEFEFLVSRESNSFTPDFEEIGKNLDGVDTVFLCNPNNPTGVLVSGDDIEALCRSFPEKHFIIDESYLPFADTSEKESMLSRGVPNVIVLNSMSKIFRIPGLRIGFLISSSEIIKKHMRYAMPWSVNSLAHAVVTYLMTNREIVDNFIQETRTMLDSEKNRFLDSFKDVERLKLYPSTTSFLLGRLKGKTSEAVCEALADQGILIRNCANFQGLSNEYIRISLKMPEINSMLIKKLETIIK